jgi:hypothetical protein
MSAGGIVPTISAKCERVYSIPVYQAPAVVLGKRVVREAAYGETELAIRRTSVSNQTKKRFGQRTLRRNNES